MNRLVDEHHEQLGRQVRAVWIGWAEQQPDPKPSWLVPYDELTEAEKDVDRRIGVALWNDGFATGQWSMASAGHTSEGRATLERLRNDARVLRDTYECREPGGVGGSQPGVHCAECCMGTRIATDNQEEYDLAVTLDTLLRSVDKVLASRG